MFGYYLNLALRSFKRNKALTALMVLAIALGIGTSTTMLAVLHNLSGDPIPARSGMLYHPQIDPRPASLPGADPEPPDDLTWQDANALYALPGAGKRVMTSSNWLPVRTDVPNSPLSMETTRATTAELFGMFNLQFLYGTGWSMRDDADHALVVVLSKALNEKLFGGADSIGRTLIIATKNFRVVGVVDDWNPRPRFHDLSSGAFGKPERLFMPFSTWLDLPQDYGYGPMQCWSREGNTGTHNPKAPQCTWVQFWVQLDSAAQVAAYRQTLLNYSTQQHRLGRFERAPNVRLRNVIDWLDYKRVVPATVRMQTWIAFGVLLVCLVNAIGLLVARFLRKSREIGVRRALGASRRAVFLQCLTESGLIGLISGLVGLPLAWFGLWLVRQQPMPYAANVHMDPLMLCAAIVLAVFSALLAGLWPAWRASGIAPALQVKSP